MPFWNRRARSDANARPRRRYYRSHREIFVQSYDGGFSNTITCSHYHEQTNLCYDYPENCAIQVRPREVRPRSPIYSSRSAVPANYGRPLTLLEALRSIDRETEQREGTRQSVTEEGSGVQPETQQATSQQPEALDARSIGEMSTHSMLRVIADDSSHEFRQSAIQAATKQQKAIRENCKKNGEEAPDYELLEMIGKGAYGRVYKSRDTLSNATVAIKIIDAEAIPEQGLRDTQKEIEILRTLQKSHTVNVNTLVDAFPVLSSLWIVSEYCPGGSLTTLRRGQNRLTENHIRPIARELAFALRSVHEAGIVHRDVKCSNVMVHENGSLQLIDFGVAGLIQTNMEEDKRTTIIGTPHWMPPEMQKNVKEVAHSFEVDVWAYGITLYECAMGAPPNAYKMGRQLQNAIRHSPPRLNPQDYSEELCDLVASACELDPKKRPSMAQLCEHKYIANTSEEHPTTILKNLVEQFYNWQFKGGIRSSMLENPHSAAPMILLEGDDTESDWNFSMTDKFEKRMSSVSNELDLSFTFPGPSDNNKPFEEETVRQVDTAGRTNVAPRLADLDDNARVARGKQALQGLFEEEPSPTQDTGKSDLPFRTGSGSSSLHHKELSINSNNGQPMISLNNPPKQAKRDTQAWTFADNQPPPLTDSKRDTQAWTFANNQPPPLKEASYEGQSESFTFPSSSDFPPERPQLRHAATMPTTESDYFTRSESEQADRRGTLDLDALLNPDPPGLNAASRGTLDLDALLNSESFDTESASGGESSFFSARPFAPSQHDRFTEEPLDSFETAIAMGDLDPNTATMRPSFYSSTQLDRDNSFAEFDQINSTTASFAALNGHQFPSFMTDHGTESLASQTSTRLPSPEPGMLNNADLPLSPPPASPPLPSQFGGQPVTNGMNGLAARWNSNSPHQDGWYPRPPRPETMVPDAPQDLMLEELVFQANQLIEALDRWGEGLDACSDNGGDVSGDEDDDEDEDEDDDGGSEEAGDEDESEGEGEYFGSSFDEGTGESEEEENGESE